MRSRFFFLIALTCAAAIFLGARALDRVAGTNQCGPLVVGSGSGAWHARHHREEREADCGGGGRDKLIGGGGRDRLLGQAGKDICKGGPKRDVARKCEVKRSI